MIAAAIARYRLLAWWLVICAIGMSAALLVANGVSL